MEEPKGQNESPCKIADKIKLVIIVEAYCNEGAQENFNEENHFALNVRHLRFEAIYKEKAKCKAQEKRSQIDGTIHYRSVVFLNIRNIISSTKCDSLNWLVFVYNYCRKNDENDKVGAKDHYKPFLSALENTSIYFLKFIR